MRLMFVYWKVKDAGSAQTINNYASVARNLGHEVVLYAPEGSASRFPCSVDVESADALVFVLEWNIYYSDDGPLDLEGPVAGSLRKRRVVIDNDGMYHNAIQVSSDYNHPDAEASRQRIALYDSISDKICQPTLHPVRPNVRSFLFHGYNPAWEASIDLRHKEFGMFYLGSNWFRWRAMERVLRAIEPIRDQVGRIGLAGHDWGAMPWWVESPLREQAYYTDPAYLEKLDVELLPPVPVEEVVPTMSRGLFNPVLVRPVFNHLRLVNPRQFETPAANTIPLFGLDPQFVEEIHGSAALELVLGDDPSVKIADVLRRPQHYARVVKEVRAHLRRRHSYAVRLQELIDLVHS